MSESTLPKWFIASRGVMGPLVAIVAILLTAKGVEVSADEQTFVLETLDAVLLGVVSLIGSVVGIYGRVKAKTAVTALPVLKP